MDSDSASTNTLYKHQLSNGTDSVQVYTDHTVSRKSVYFEKTRQQMVKETEMETLIPLRMKIFALYFTLHFVFLL